ncbi:lysozyme inhibitor LprI family protein [Chelativorans sp. AA-79]|uniref:lysozyme inhibitor LprI family protein n=1 Tax=Chelativorans sp. AA-79 TaxID=3028735 RepID=UPI0023F895AA|nr:lysozyme inhibitor LprI family protein [Chelativorans sp. AA-79]WEX07631.1 DUF4232 domain-containing protein [Chelativorans sp. AA-79]
MRIFWFAPFLFLLAAGFAPMAYGQSFDCQKAETDTEWAICNTPELGKLDSELATIYRRLLASGKEVPDFRKKVEQMQTSWIHGRRDLCGGDVDCLTTAYNAIQAALNALPPAEAAPAGAQAENTVAPACDGRADTSDPAPAAQFARSVCGNREMLETARRIDDAARALRPKLPGAWRTAFDAQQAAFPGTPNMCPGDDQAKLDQCIATALKQRLVDIQSLAAFLERPVRDCTPAEISVEDSDIGDGGMSQSIAVYLFTYKGSDACVIRGYPAVSVLDGQGRPQPDFIAYSGGTYFSRTPVPPLPVVLSPESRTAWFAVHTASACDPGVGPLKARVALPAAQDWIRTIDYPGPICPKLTFTPAAMISTLLSSVY